MSGFVLCLMIADCAASILLVLMVAVMLNKRLGEWNKLFDFLSCFADSRYASQSTDEQSLGVGKLM